MMHILFVSFVFNSWIFSETDTHKTASQLNSDLKQISTLANKWKVKFTADQGCDLIFSEQVMNNSLPILIL